MKPNTTLQPPAFFNFDAIKPTQSYAELFGAVRELCQGEASRDAFINICTQLERAALVNQQATIEEMIPYIEGHVSRWPSNLRMAPLLWINRLILFALPVEAIGVVSALSFTAALCQWNGNPYNELLFDWLSQLPEDAPALDGLTVSRCQKHITAIMKAQQDEPEERFHAKGCHEYLSVDYTLFCDYESEEITHLLSSPLTRHLRVLDMSWDAIHKLVDSQEMSYGRNFTTADACYLTNSDRLEVIDLHGHNFTPQPRTIDRNDEKEVLNGQRIKELNIGGGHPYGIKTIKALVKDCPNITWLNISAGTMTSFVFDSDFDFDTEWMAREASRIGVYDKKDIKAMKRTPAVSKALKGLKLSYLYKDTYSSHAGELWERHYAL